MLSMENISMQLFMVRGAYGYKGFSEQVGENLYKSNSKAFQEAIENAREPIDPNRVSSLSSKQTKMLSSASNSSWMIPLLNRMGQLGMIDLREGLANPNIINRLQNTSYNTAINAYKRSI